MKQRLTNILGKTSAFILVFLISFRAYAQDSSGSNSMSSTTTSTSTWYAQPWVWVVGGVVLLLIIILAARGGRSTDTVRVEKTIVRDDV